METHQPAHEAVGNAGGNALALGIGYNQGLT